ncbi:Jerky -like [Araneus ventricosus]|uniref:Jerky-like n=1 Tax=Araneus ventricosus TaxID=182803 RepID=A0A4Y2VS42_ARAVE|nr:Jerky -like [Araneus ventricosus]
MLPVCYRGQENAWVTRELFLDWFKTEFVPALRQHMESINLLQQALFLLYNCPGHPSAEELCTNDGEHFRNVSTPNTTALIQPMDQNVIQNIKLGYRKLLLTNILNDPVHNENLGKTLMNVNLKNVVFSFANCWTSVPTLLINKSCKNLLPNFVDAQVE